MKLSRTERWILSNQFQILEKLAPKEGWDFAREVVERGYELHYGDVSQYVYQDVLTEEHCREVVNILAMFSHLKRAYAALPEEDKQDIEEAAVSFLGFDGNNEARQLSYTLLLVDHEGRFTDLDRLDDFNSHSPVLDTYRRMLAEYERSANKYSLTKDDVVRIVNARIHPSRR